MKIDMDKIVDWLGVGFMVICFVLLGSAALIVLRISLEAWGVF